MIEVKISKEEVNEVMAIQEIRYAYENLANVLRSNPEIREEFIFLEEKRKVMQEEYECIQNWMMQWWNKIYTKYNMNHEDLHDVYVDYHTQTIRHRNE